jgi:hypothetical protein
MQLDISGSSLADEATRLVTFLEDNRRAATW